MLEPANTVERWSIAKRCAVGNAASFLSNCMSVRTVSVSLPPRWRNAGSVGESSPQKGITCRFVSQYLSVCVLFHTLSVANLT